MTARPGDPVLAMTRELDAPRAAVFASWLDPDRLMRWWAPPRPLRATPARTAQLDEVVRFRGRGPDGRERWLEVVYVEIVPPERIVFTWGGDAIETRTLVTVRFAERGPGKTTVVLSQAVLRHHAPQELLAQHYAERLDRLAAFLATAG